MHLILKKFIASMLCLYISGIYAQETIYPSADWSIVPANDLGINQQKVDRLFDLSFEDPATQGVVLIKNGHLIGERYADGYDQD